MNCLTTKEILERHPAVDVLCSRAMKSFLAADFADADKALEEADALAAGEDAPLRSCIALTRAQVRDNQGRSEENLMEIEKLLKELSRRESMIGLVLRVQAAHSECLMGNLSKAGKDIDTTYDDAAASKDRLLAGQAALRKSMQRFRMQHWTDASTMAQEALAIALEYDDDLLNVYSRMVAAKVLTHSKDCPSGMAMFEELLKETDKAGYSFLSAKLLAEIACCLSKLEQSDKAVEYYQRADALLESAPCNPAKNVILANLGNIWLERGEYDKALDAYRQASDMADAAGDQFARARWMKNLAVAYRESGDTHRSKQEALRAAGLFRLCGDIKSAEGCEKLCEKRAGLSK